VGFLRPDRVTTEGSCRRSTISAVWYGDCRNSQGTLGTDKLFTGQRLDDTGLYYYGARYYDPTIGRFISPDTIVQNPANPQSLNRYSYVLNNPLKYIDPSGQVADIEYGGVSYNVEDLYSTLDYISAGYAPYMPALEAICSPLFQAYDELKGAAPELTGELESSPITISFQLGQFASLSGGISAIGKTEMVNSSLINTTLNSDYGNNIKILARNMGNEGFHGAVLMELGQTENFAENEAFSYGFEFALAGKLGCEPSYFANTLQNYNPNNLNGIASNEFRARTIEASRELSPVYSRQNQWWWLPWEPSIVPLAPFSKNDSNGIRTLTVANSVWIK
jgi:RHS repeat-associated protein